MAAIRRPTDPAKRRFFDTSGACVTLGFLRYCDVSLPVPLDQPFTYELPETLRHRALPGCRLLVPFGPRSLTGVILRVHDDPGEGPFREALRLRRSFADSAVIAYSENAVGWILAHLGQPDAALWYCRRALEMHTDSGSRTGIADTLDSIAYAYAQLANYEQSIAHYERAQEMYRLLGDPTGEANSRLHLGDVQLAAGQRDAARGSWEQALALLARVPGADTSEVNRRLRPGAESDNRNDRADSGAVKLPWVVSEPFHPGDADVAGGH